MLRRAPFLACSWVLGCAWLLMFSACSKAGTAPPVTEIDTGLPVDTGTRDVAVTDTGSNTAASDGATEAGDGAVDAPIGAKCSKTFVGDKATAVDYAHGPGELLAGLTWDELTMVWTTVEASRVVVHYADRAGRDDAFTAAKTLPDTLGPFAEDSVALAADGKSMLLVSADHTTLTQLSRSARGAAFEAAALTGVFERITGTGSEGGPIKKLGDLVLSKDGQSLFYTDLQRTAGTTLMVSLRLSDGTWDYPNPVDGAPFEMSGSQRRRPTGISADGLTLFFYDEVFGASYLAFRTPGSLLFPETVAFSPTGRRATPTEACDRVYLSMAPPVVAPDSGPPDATGEVGDARPPAALTIHHAP
ncbi:MAG: hypothetical protein JNL79_40700 [Myxococcales bacterium]|nr:hypothetical protein [Myxococcales bacterium]